MIMYDNANVCGSTQLWSRSTSAVSANEYTHASGAKVNFTFYRSTIFDHLGQSYNNEKNESLVPCLILHVIESVVVCCLFEKYRRSKVEKKKKEKRNRVYTCFMDMVLHRHCHRKIRFRFIVGNNGVV